MPDKENKKNNVVQIVNAAKRPKGFDSRPKNQAFDEYAIKAGSFNLKKKIRAKDDGDGVEILVPLCNFTARITEEITQDNGLEDCNFLKIQVTRADGLVLQEVEVSFSKFFSSMGNWINENYGTRLFIETGAAKRDHLRACIQKYSTLGGDIPSRHVYAFTGWKKLDNQWHYLTGSGAINADGLRQDVNVDLGQGHMGRYKLPAPLIDAQEQTNAIQAIFDLLAICPDKPHIGGALLSVVARAPLGECHPVDFGLFIHGFTGTKKSSVTSVALAFFGEFGGGEFPSNWSDTDNDMESKSFQAKDALFVVDDFKPSVSSSEAARLHAKAERFIRNTGNRAGRGRRTKDMVAKAAPYNRSMTIITGEDLPRGQSLLGRLLILELLRNDVDLERLTRLQFAARDSVLARLMARYLQWLAPRIDAYKQQLPATVLRLRDECIKSELATSHPRAPDIYASLVGGAEVFLSFLLDTEAVTPAQYAQLFKDLQANLRNAFSEQGEYQKEQDECERFLNLLRALFSSKKAHLACAITQGAPSSRAGNWGWVCPEVRGIDTHHTVFESPMGVCIGWIDDKSRQLLLSQESVFAAVQELSRSQGEPFLVSAATLWRRMGDKGLIIKFETRDNGTKQWTVKRVIGEARKRVMVISADLIEGIA